MIELNLFITFFFPYIYVTIFLNLNLPVEADVFPFKVLEFESFNLPIILFYKTYYIWSLIEIDLDFTLIFDFNYNLVKASNLVLILPKGGFAARGVVNSYNGM